VANPLKKLASQTAVYGLSTILPRFLNYWLVPFFTYKFTNPADFGMKKVFALSISLLACMLIASACTKKSSTTTTTPTPSSTTSVPSNTVTTNFTVDGTATGNPTSYTTTSGSNFAVIGEDGSQQKPQILLVFSGASSPASATYPIVNTYGAAPTAGHCELILTTTSGSYPASSGNVTVVTSGASSSAYFSNITCTNSTSSPTTHTVTGNIQW